MPHTLSIITVNLNNLKGLKKTMQSVFEQTFTDYEYIIIDGGSTDGSKEYIEQHSDKLAYWVSEKDGGVYEGMNKGIEKTKGEYLMFLNSGDYLLKEDVLSFCDQIINANPADIYYGDMQIVVENKVSSKKHPDELTFDYLIHQTINHQASFINQRLFGEIGFYNLQYRYAADHEFYLKALLKGYRFCHIQSDLVFYDMNGMTSKNWEKYSKDMNKIEEEYFPRYYKELRKENNDYKNLMQQRIMKYAFKINQRYQHFRKALKRR